MTRSQSKRVVALLTGLCAGALLLPAAAQEPFDRGKALYEHHCMACHESWAHTRQGRRVRTVAELRQRAEAWSVHSRLDWTAEDINDVVEYLNRSFYQMETRP